MGLVVFKLLGAALCVMTVVIAYLMFMNLLGKD